jgi:regulator of protease activity HflC (stomatin/prohibitin superfamily)
MRHVGIDDVEILLDRRDKISNSQSGIFEHISEADEVFLNGETKSASLQGLECWISKLDDVVIQSNLAHPDPNTQTRNIIKEFNKRVIPGQNTFEKSLFFGDWVNPDCFILGACNQIPEIQPYDGSQKLRRGWYIDPTINTEMIAIRQQTHPIYGKYGSYVLNVPPNKYALAWSGLQPKIYGVGPHVIHDANFRFDCEKGYKDQIHYYIHHGSIHILRVPAGYVAKIWIGENPFLLESIKTPYVFNSDLFKIVKSSKEELFFDATSELLINGSIKRVMPHTGRVAVTYDNGNLKIIGPDPNGPTIIMSPTHEVSSFLDTNIQSYTFPSEDEKKQRLKNNDKITSERLNHYVFLTSDSLEIGMKLLVSYKITDPHKTLSLLGEKGILNTVENLASVDMAKVVNTLSSQEFLNPYSSANIDKTAQPAYFWEKIHSSFRNELRAFGIELVRFNIESPFYVDKEIGKKMSEFATMTAEANARQGIIERQARVQEAEARRDANTNQIKQDQINEATISAAKAHLEAKRLEAEGVQILAGANARELELTGEVFRKYPELLEFQKIKVMAQAIGNGKLVMSYPAQPIEHLLKTGSFESPAMLFGEKSTRHVCD